MSKISVDPYLFFKGDAREALEFYHNIFGGKIEIMAFKDSGMEPGEGLKEDNVMHGALVDARVSIMASDGATASDRSAKTVICLSAEPDDEEYMRKVFDQLSEDVEPEYPLKKEFWGDIFGSLRDKYGVEWMINIAGKKQ